ncbi:hypothetical protein BDR03DRAFT_986906 [Suillus americanus]|nr:hypothetical protein BDR03DRAFT_986906 [Suillus americanus]
MSTFDFSNIINPEAERIQCIFADLHLHLVNLANMAPEDQPDLMACKEERGCDWMQLMCSLEGKTYNLGLALTAKESDMGRQSDELHQCYQAHIRTFKLEAQHQAEEAAEEEAWREAEKDKGSFIVSNTSFIHGNVLLHALLLVLMIVRHAPYVEYWLHEAH